MSPNRDRAYRRATAAVRAHAPSWRQIAAVILCLGVFSACREDSEPAPETSRAARTGAPARRTTSEPASTNIDLLATELAAARACERLRDQFRALPAGNGSTALGTLWIRDCVYTANGHDVTFAVGGDAWRVLPGRSGEAPERFGFSLTVTGRIASTYDPSTRVLTVRFEPTDPSKFFVVPRDTTIRDSRMDTAITSALATALSAPNHAPALADVGTDPRFGVTAKIPVCNPVPVFAFESLPAIPSGAGDPGTPVELAREAIALFGPQPARGGLELAIEAMKGSVHAAVVCQRDARRIAARFLQGKAERAQPIAETTTAGSARLVVPDVACPVTLVVRPTRGDAVFRWHRPIIEGVGAVEAGPLRCAPVVPQPELRAPR